MRSWLQSARYLFTAVTVAGRTVYNAGQAYFSVDSFAQYANIANRSGGVALTSIAVVGSVGSTILGKTVATYNTFHFGKKEVALRTNTNTDHPLGWPAWVAQTTLRAGGLGYGAMNSLVAFFGTVVISYVADNVINPRQVSPLDPELLAPPPWKMGLIFASAGFVAVLAGFSYFAYDYQVIKDNTRMIAEAVDARHFVPNRDAWKTIAASGLNLVTYPMQAYFFAGPSIAAIPYVGEAIGPVGVSALSWIASGVTFLTVISWLPSVYEFFHQTAPQQQSISIPNTPLSLTLRISSYLFGVIDAMAANGLGPFISVITFMHNKFATDSYGGVIALAALCGIYAAFMDYLFSVIPATTQLLEAAYPDGTDVERLPLVEIRSNPTSPRPVVKSDSFTAPLEHVDKPPEHEDSAHEHENTMSESYNTASECEDTGPEPTLPERTPPPVIFYSQDVPNGLLTFSQPRPATPPPADRLEEAVIDITDASIPPVASPSLRLRHTSGGE